MKISPALLLAAASLIGLSLAASARAEPKARVGVLMPFSGEMAAITEKTRRGFSLAAEEFGDQVQVIFEDTGGMDKSRAVAGAAKLLEIDKVSIVVGPFGPEQTLPVAAVAARYQAPVLSFSLCSGAFTGLANLFCGYPSTRIQLQSMLPLLEEKKLESLGIISEESVFGNESAALLVELAGARKIAIPVRDSWQIGDLDFRSSVAKVRRTQPQAVFVAFANPAHAFTVLKQLHESGYRGERFAYIDYDDKYLKEFGAFTEGLYVPGAYTGSYSADFLARYRRRFEEEPDLYAAEGYDLLAAAVAALAANGWKKDGLTQKIIALPYDHTAISGFRLLPDRTVSFPMGVLTARSGRFVAVR